jgi:hypothetical protein
MREGDTIIVAFTVHNKINIEDKANLHKVSRFIRTKRVKADVDSKLALPV